MSLLTQLSSLPVQVVTSSFLMSTSLGVLGPDDFEGLYKREQSCISWTRGNKIAKLDGPRICIDSSAVDAEMKAKFTVLLSCQLRMTASNESDPSRKFVVSPSQACHQLAATSESLMRGHYQTDQQLAYEQETWKLLEMLLRDQESGLKDRILRWINDVCRKRIYEIVESAALEDRFITTLGFLVAANLNLDAAKLAISVGEVDLGQLLLCRRSPRLMERLTKGYKEGKHCMKIQSGGLGLPAILDYLAGNTEPLLSLLRVDWKIRLSSLLSEFDENEGKPITMVLDEFCKDCRKKVAVDETQFEILVLFSRFGDGFSVDDGTLEKILQTDMNSINCGDVCFKWQILSVLAAANLIEKSKISGDSVCQLCNTMCDQCESLGIPEYSVFVALHQNIEPRIREEQIKRILSMNACNLLDDTEKEDFLLNDLHVPRSLLAKAKEWMFLRNGDVEKEVECLVEIGDFEAAHSLVIRKFIPNVILSDKNLRRAIKFLEDTQLCGNRDGIGHWDVGGGLLIEIHKVLSSSTSSDEESICSSVDQFGRLNSLIRNGQQFWMQVCETDEERENIRRMNDMLSLELDRVYYQSFSQVHGDQNAMSKILQKRYKTRAGKSAFWQ